MRGKSLPDSLVDEVEALVAAQMADSGIQLERFNQVDARSYNPTDSGAWHWGEASWFALHEAVSGKGIICPFLTAQWNEVRPRNAIANVARGTQRP
ncbi:MAG: hypothetical protein NDJ90_02820 [Oligoflexia bacterium]|nr:hypothetical protein [Oligoflexia bacterium]